MGQYYGQYIIATSCHIVIKEKLVILLLVQFIETWYVDNFVVINCLYMYK